MLKEKLKKDRKIYCKSQRSHAKSLGKKIDQQLARQKEIDQQLARQKELETRQTCELKKSIQIVNIINTMQKDIETLGKTWENTEEKSDHIIGMLSEDYQTASRIAQLKALKKIHEQLGEEIKKYELATTPEKDFVVTAEEEGNAGIAPEENLNEGWLRSIFRW